MPVSAVLTSAPVHDSQVAIPLATTTAGRVASLHDLMDAAHDAKEIREKSEGLGHVPVIDVNPRRDTGLKEELKREARALRTCGLVMPESVRCRIRSGVGRTNARLKDGFGGRHVRVRGHAKVFNHLMLGVLALTVDQLMRLPVLRDAPTASIPFGKALENRRTARPGHRPYMFGFCSSQRRGDAVNP